jgi:phosphotransferase system enzyme I (PtsI)
LSEPELFRIQIRAILRAAVVGNIHLMFPMVIDVQDMQAAKYFVAKCCSELIDEGIDFNPDLPVGAMIEIPSAALTADSLAQECDFFSIGTNDLTQYTLAVDRNNSTVAEYYQSHHPAVLELIKMTVQCAHAHHIPVAVCGEMASDLHFIPLLLAYGVDELSVNPKQYLNVKAAIRHYTVQQFGYLQYLGIGTPIEQISRELGLSRQETEII